MLAFDRRCVAFVIVAVLVHSETVGAQPPQAWPRADWPTATAVDAAMDENLLMKARDYALSGGGAGLITRGGRIVLSWGDINERFDLKSTTKSFGATALGLAIGDGKMALSDKAKKHHSSMATPPNSNADTGWIGEIMILHLATQTAGFEKPGGYTKLMFKPGAKWAYSDGGPNWLAECITLAYRQDVDKLMFDRVFTPLGIDRRDLVWRENSYRAKKINGIVRREFGSGISANVDAMARIGLLYLRGGVWKEQRILPDDFVKQAGTTVEGVVGLDEVDTKTYGNASDHYGLLWWDNSDGTLSGVPRDAYWSWGLYDSLIVVIPSLDVVVARAGRSWQRASKGEHYDVLRPFLEPIVAAVMKTPPNGGGVSDRADSRTDEERTPKAFDDLLEHDSDERAERKSRSGSTATPPYSPSTVIRDIEWSPASSIVRRARGSDNWPLTWADDNNLYTAYGDGKGFEPLVDKKLSMGLARISGSADDFTAVNIRAPTFETYGDGNRGKKASGLLMVDGVLYLWARNAENSQLAWSTDRGGTWSWGDWKFATSFGCPTFLNYGRNYAGARDKYVYIFSHDNDSAYEPADRMVMARVPAKRIRERAQYEFFQARKADGTAVWTKKIDDRGAVFENAGHCYRSGITYNAALRRYFWCRSFRAAIRVSRAV